MPYATVQQQTLEFGLSISLPFYIKAIEFENKQEKKSNPFPLSFGMEPWNERGDNKNTKEPAAAASPNWAML